MLIEKDRIEVRRKEESRLNSFGIPCSTNPEPPIKRLLYTERFKASEQQTKSKGRQRLYLFICLFLYSILVGGVSADFLLLLKHFKNLL